MHALGGAVMRDRSEPAPERDSIQTLVTVRRRGWRFAAFQNTRLRPMSSAPAFLVSTISDLLWKIVHPNKRTKYE